MSDQRASLPTLPAAALPRRVLLVDDEEPARRLLGASLRAAGFELTAVADGAAALAVVENAPPDVLLLDFSMPGIDGAEVCRRLRASPRTALNQLPVVMLTSHTGEAEEIACLTAGANDFVTKPISRAVLVARIETQLRLAALAEKLREQNREMAQWREVQEADLAVARTTQQAIIRSVPPQVEGWQVEVAYEPLIQIGGDVYGWRHLAPGRWLFWVADATGHGVAAALFTSLVAHLFHLAGSATSTASAILAHVNAEFFGVLRGHSFMTAACVVIDAAGCLSFAGAGHPPLLVRRCDGTLEKVAPLGLMMGLSAIMEPDETALHLAPGDVALLYTDGLFSLPDAAGERCSLDTVATALAQLKPGTGLPARLIAQLGPQPAFDDDMTVLALRRI